MTHEFSYFMVRFWMEMPNSDIFSRRICGPHLGSLQLDRDTYPIAGKCKKVQIRTSIILFISTAEK